MSAHKNKKKININLLINEHAPENFTDQIFAWALTYGRYIIIATQIIVLSVFFLRFKLDRDFTDLKESVSQKQALIESVSDLEYEIRRIQGKLSYVKQITSTQPGLMNVIHFLQNNAPSETTFTTLSLSQEKIQFNAVVSNLRSFSFFLSRLQQDTKFQDVTLEDIFRRADGRIEFKIHSKINIKGFS